MEDARGCRSYVNSPLGIAPLLQTETTTMTTTLPQGDPGVPVIPVTPEKPVNELRTPLPTYDERKAAGRVLRDRVRRGDLGHWQPPKDRPDPVDLIIKTNSGRLESLIPVRIGRMVASPFAFLRGAAALMAEDFARLPKTGIEPIIGGDAHLSNFGFYASPERNLVFDLNDFDESHPGPWGISGQPSVEEAADEGVVGVGVAREDGAQVVAAGDEDLDGFEQGLGPAAQESLGGKLVRRIERVMTLEHGEQPRGGFVARGPTGGLDPGSSDSNRWPRAICGPRPARTRRTGRDRGC